MLLAEPRIPGWTTLAVDYIAYADAVGRKANAEIVKRLDADDEQAVSEAEELIEVLYGGKTHAH